MSHKKEKTILLFTIFSAYLSVTSGQSCTTPSRQAGTCIVVQSCPVYYNMIVSSNGALTESQRQMIANSWCGMEGTKHKVCCPNAQRPTSLSQTVSPAVTSGVYDYTSHPSARFLEPKKCGNIVEDRIARGNKTDPFQFPWMAIIQYRTNEGIEQLCGGTTISQRYVLTAAHCIIYLRGGMTVHSVILGEHNTKTEEDCDVDDVCTDPIQEILIESVIPHPMYSRRTFTNDIGLVRLTRNADFATESVRPICLPMTVEVQTQPLTLLKVTGWGRTENGTVSDALLQANLDIVDNERCATLYKQKTGLTVIPTHLCAGTGTIDSCQGDSGGPAIFPGPTMYGPRYIQYGVVSAGNTMCGSDSGIPGLYTRVIPFMKWILDTMKP